MALFLYMGPGLIRTLNPRPIPEVAMRSPTRHYVVQLCTMILTFLVLTQTARAEEVHKPYILVEDSPAEAAEVVARTRDRLQTGGFNIVGEYAPYPRATVLVVTSPALKKAAAQSEKGGFGAALRVSITEVGDNVQVAYTNPTYMAHAYRMNGDLSEVSKRMQEALGVGKPFGAEGLSTNKLRKYHYMFMRPYFDDTDLLGTFSSYDEAIRVVENGLREQAGGVAKVYRVDVPEKQETLFGVHLTHECSADRFIMDKIDFGEIKSTPHLPYEVLVSGNEVHALPADFRIAISFPDLSMVGSNSFFSIMCAPDAVRGALQNMVDGKPAGAE